jgi:hypothetical protein
MSINKIENSYYQLFNVIQEYVKQIQEDGVALTTRDIHLIQKLNSFSKIEEIENHSYLNGIINSSIASYFIFATLSSECLGTKTQDLVRLSVPKPSEDNKGLIAQIIEVESKLRESSPESVEDLKQQLDQAVFDLYGLSNGERVLVEDTTHLYINKTSVAFNKPEITDLEAYTLSFMGVIQPLFDTLKEKSIAADIFDITDAPLQVVKFSIVPYPGREQIVQTVHADDLITVLESIAKQVPSKFADHVFTQRNLKVYAGRNIYIIKPCQLRYWTRSAGLHNADTVLLENSKISMVN